MNKREDASGVKHAPDDPMYGRTMPKLKGVAALTVEHPAIGKTMKIPVRRGTGPKASIKKFIAAYDAWRAYIEYFDGDIDSMSYEELCKMGELETAMFEARAEVKGVMGAV